MSDKSEISVENLDTARFECVFPTCGGKCCANGRPPLETDEVERVRDNLAKFLPLMRPAARVRVESDGFLTNRRKEGLPPLRVVDGWCVFFNEGCVLHKAGASEGDAYKYKPWRCATFPLERRTRGKWFVRQWKLRGEAWDLFCLNPAESPKKASETLAPELELARKVEAERGAATDAARETARVAR